MFFIGDSTVSTMLRDQVNWYTQVVYTLWKQLKCEADLGDGRKECACALQMKGITVTPQNRQLAD